jgi:hypothetical protein
MVMILSSNTASHGPVGSSLVSRRVTVPKKSAAGVYVTANGFANCAEELKLPPPEMILQDAEDAEPPMLPDERVIGLGAEDSQMLTTFGPASTVGSRDTVMVRVSETTEQFPSDPWVVNSNTTVPV